jgi:hypothetical protein
VDEDPDAAGNGLEQLQRALAGNELRQLGSRDPGCREWRCDESTVVELSKALARLSGRLPVDDFGH